LTQEVGHQRLEVMVGQRGERGAPGDCRVPTGATRTWWRRSVPHLRVHQMAASTPATMTLTQLSV
jgi:hypothetical protein